MFRWFDFSLDLLTCVDRMDISINLSAEITGLVSYRLVYYFKCGPRDPDYVGFTSRHLRQRLEEHKRSTIGNHVKDEHGQDPETIKSNFKILKKGQNKLDCLILEMFFIHDLKPKLNKQCDLIQLFV